MLVFLIVLFAQIKLNVLHAKLALDIPQQIRNVQHVMFPTVITAILILLHVELANMDTLGLVQIVLNVLIIVFLAQLQLNVQLQDALQVILIMQLV